MVEPKNEADIQEIVRDGQRLLPVGSGSKPGLSKAVDGTTAVSLKHLSGIITYDPDEYTFTAWAGTPVAEISRTLAEQGQYLPFDPLLVDAGATIGGTVAANTSGSGRLRYGGVRDFILGVRFVDGNGRLVNGGGKVVKNAAGFDLPKFMVGSLGRFGILTQVTFKVFPSPKQYVTIEVTFSDAATAMEAIFAVGQRPFELDALDFQVGATAVTMWLRLGGLSESLSERAERLEQWVGKNTAVQSMKTLHKDNNLWQSINAMKWAVGKTLIKVPIAPRRLLDLIACPQVEQAHVTSAGNVAWLAVRDVAPFEGWLYDEKLPGLLLWGKGERPLLGYQSWLPFGQRIKAALDPQSRFLKVATPLGDTQS